MKPIARVLVLSSYGLFGGDIQTLLTALKGLHPERFSLYAISKPRGDIYQILKQIPGLVVAPMELGNGELAQPYHSNKFARAVDFLLAILRIAAFVKRNQIDVIWSIDRSVDPILAAVVSRFTNCSFLLDAAFPYYPQSNVVARFVYRQATRIQVPTKHFLEKVKPYARNPDRFQVIPYALEIQDYDPSLRGTITRTKFRIDADSSVIVMMGRLTHYKGQDVLVRAAAIVLRESPQTQFLIAGRPAWGDSDNFEQSLKTMIAELGIEQNVHLVGFVDHAAIPDFIAASSLVVMPSIEEPFGLVALEGMAMARPVVATRAGGVPEFIPDGEVGLLVPPGDHQALAKAILYLLKNPEIADDMGKAARRHVVQNHTAQHYANQVEDLITTAIPAKSTD